MSDWFASHTWQSPQWTVPELVARKAGRTVSVVLPALDEEATVGDVVGVVRPLLGTLVDELVVVDSGSTDATVARASAAGARVVHRTDVLPDLPPRPGKGEVLWRSLAATSGDLVVFLDSDLVDPDPEFVPSLLGPLLTRDVHLVKGFYRRPLRLESTGGGRVTELAARPLLNALRPELAGVVQPLGGEYAGTREFLESVPFAPGYGVEIGLLLDAHTRYGLDGIAQVNLGVRKHRNRDLRQLGPMAAQITVTALRRCGVPVASSELTQFVPFDGEWLPSPVDVPAEDRPAMRSVLQRSR
ncbi:glucosyl-3-phosphoglycerate synthase [Actinosynnema sp. NPDC023658]|uniref:glucosyl-3-phosphoglycerate synthase n=1 Tax=Actinosynnema sp. NPDC023658 TaxID=3155465 RepID=UPI0033EF7D1A